MNKSISRRQLLKYGAAAAVSSALADISLARQSPAAQRTIIIMFDGFGSDYLAESKMPVVEQWKRAGPPS